jgi:TonB family protein
MRSLTVVTILAAGFLRAQSNIETLEKQAHEFEAQRQFDSAQEKLDAALKLTEQRFGNQSAEYGLCLLQLGDLGRKIHTKVASTEAAAYYTRAVRLLPNRAEAANAFLYLGILALGKKDYKHAGEQLQRAQTLDVNLAGPASMWMALMHERQDQAEEAEGLYKSAMAAGGSNTLEQLEPSTLYARFLQQHGRDDEAQSLIQNTFHPALPKVENPRPGSGSYRVGGGVSQPKLTYKVDPPYSEEARIAKISGTTLLQIIVDTDGQAKNIKVMKSIGFGLDDCAIATILKWQFSPGEKNGSPVAVYATVEINFRLL